MAEKRYSVTLPDYILPSFGWDESEAPYRIKEALTVFALCKCLTTRLFDRIFTNWYILSIVSQRDMGVLA